LVGEHLRGHRVGPLLVDQAGHRLIRHEPPTCGFAWAALNSAASSSSTLL
jgi:hypothetical protein